MHEVELAVVDGGGEAGVVVAGGGEAWVAGGEAACVAVTAGGDAVVAGAAGALAATWCEVAWWELGRCGLVCFTAGWGATFSVGLAVVRVVDVAAARVVVVDGEDDAPHPAATSGPRIRALASKAIRRICISMCRTHAPLIASRARPTTAPYPRRPCTSPS
jgi:hypothetical protein